LFQADADVRWLEWAEALQRRQDELFWDGGQGGWFSTTGLDPTVLLRMKEDYDGAEPTASSISVLNLLALSHLIENPSWSERIEKTFGYFGSRLEQMGRAVPMMAAALSTYHAGPRQIVVAEGQGDQATGALDRAIALRYLPFTLTLHVNEAARRALAARLPLVAGMRPVNGQTTAYVCRDFACRAPATTVEALESELL
jgi:uncharacterized protein YyaL (SSP411 family)